MGAFINKIKPTIIIVVLLIFINIAHTFALAGTQKEYTNPTWGYSSTDPYNTSQKISDMKTTDTDVNTLKSESVDIIGVITSAFNYFVFNDLDMPLYAIIVMNIINIGLIIALTLIILSITRDFASFIPFIGGD